MARRVQKTATQKRYEREVKNLRARITTQYRKHGIIIEVDIPTYKELVSQGKSYQYITARAKELKGVRGKSLVEKATKKFNIETGEIEDLVPSSNEVPIPVEMDADDLSSVDYRHGVTGEKESRWDEKQQRFVPLKNKPEKISTKKVAPKSQWYGRIIDNFYEEANQCHNGRAYAHVVSKMDELREKLKEDYLTAFEENGYDMSDAVYTAEELADVTFAKAIQEAKSNGDFVKHSYFYSFDVADELISLVSQFTDQFFEQTSEDIILNGQVSEETEELEGNE